MTKKIPTVKITDELKELIRSEYVQGTELDTGERKMFSLDDLIKKYNVSSTTVYRLSTAQHWKAQREEFRVKFNQELDDKRRQLLVSESVKLDQQALDASKKLFKKAIAMIDQADKPSWVVQISQALVNAQKVAKLALGEATDNMNVNANIQDTDAFRRAMELLDSVADQRRQGNDQAIH